MRRWCNLPLVRALVSAIACVSVLAGATTVAYGAAAEKSSAPPLEIPPAQIEAAERLETKLTGQSKNEPPLCKDLFEVRFEAAGGVTPGGGFQVSPASAEIAGLTPSTSYAYCVSIHNRSNRTIDYQLSTDELTGSSDPDQQVEVVMQPTALGAWTKPQVSSVKVKSGDRAYVPYLITTPSSMPLGTLTARLVITKEPPKEAAGAPAAVRVSLTHRIYLTQPGGTNQPLQAKDVRAPSLVRDVGLPMRYRVKAIVTNIGSELDVYQARLEVKGFGRTVAKIENGEAAILPDGAQRVEVLWKDLPWIGLFHPKLILDGRGGQTEVQLPWVLILPAWPWLVVLGIAILTPVFVGIRRWRQNRADWMQYLDDEDEEWDDDEQWA